MYCEFFGFNEKPFTITPNPNFIFLSRTHKEAFAHLLYGIDSHAGFIALTGEVGTGKTTVLRTLLAQLDSGKYRTALIFNPCLSRGQLLANICRDLGVEVGEDNNLGYLEALNRFLLEQNSLGRTVVLVIDEAQALERDKLIQIILAGQPELDDLLHRHDLRQLNQRITVRCHLTPMKLHDTTDYINHRLKISGCRIPGLFSRGAVKQIYRYSQGIPRLINVACENALVMAWTQESLCITRSIVGRVMAEA